MTSVRLVVCSAFAAALLLPAVAAAQGPNHSPSAVIPMAPAMAAPPPPPAMPAMMVEPPCSATDEPASCLTQKLKAELAEHRLSRARAAALRRRIAAARFHEAKARKAFRSIEAELGER